MAGWVDGQADRQVGWCTAGVKVCGGAACCP